VLSTTRSDPLDLVDTLTSTNAAAGVGLPPAQAVGKLHVCFFPFLLECRAWLRGVEVLGPAIGRYFQPPLQRNVSSRPASAVIRGPVRRAACLAVVQMPDHADSSWLRYVQVDADASETGGGLGRRICCDSSSFIVFDGR
jgi:hypothetical protein